MGSLFMRLTEIDESGKELGDRYLNLAAINAFGQVVEVGITVTAIWRPNHAPLYVKEQDTEIAYVLQRFGKLPFLHLTRSTPQATRKPPRRIYINQAAIAWISEVHVENDEQTLKTEIVFINGSTPLQVMESAEDIARLTLTDLPRF